MARTKAKIDAIKPDEGVIVPRSSSAEQGFNGLRIANKKILEESQRAFRYPDLLFTIREMRNNPTVGAALNVYRFMMLSHKWSVKPQVGASETDIERARIIGTMMQDMEGTWEEFIGSVIPYLEYGFAINEIVPYRRLARNGSKYNDGVVGIKKLATRCQETIYGWEFSPDGSELLKIWQDPKFLENQHLYVSKMNSQGRIEMDRDKCLIFSASSTKGNPEGNSIFKNIYLAHKQMTLLQENQLIGVGKEMQGMLLIGIPPEYLSAAGSDDQKATALGFQKIIDNHNQGTQKGMLVPLRNDPETNQPMFKYEFLESKGVSKYDTESIIRGYQQDILTALSVDVLRLGADGSGSFSLAESKTSILTLAVSHRMREIQSVLNSHLMKYLFKLNGWNTENLPTFEFAQEEDLDLDSFSAAIQRIFAVGAIELDREVMNIVRKSIGATPRPDDEPVDKGNLSTVISQVESSAGQGMAVGTSGNGTAKINGKGSSKDTSTSNKANPP